MKIIIIIIPVSGIGKNISFSLQLQRTCWGGSETKINTQVTRNYQNKTGKP